MYIDNYIVIISYFLFNFGGVTFNPLDPPLNTTCLIKEDDGRRDKLAKRVDGFNDKWN